MAGGRVLPKNDTRRDPFVRLELDAAEAEAAALEERAYAVEVAVDQVGHDEGLRPALEAQEERDRLRPAHLLARAGTLIDHRAGRAGGAEDARGTTQAEAGGVQGDLGGL